MSEKNFKIGSAGLDLDGGLLLTNVLANAVSFNGNLLASQEYVDGAISNIDQDLSDNAGLHIDWNAGTSAFDVNVNSLVGDLDGTGLYVDNNQIAVNTNVIASISYVDSAINAIPSVNTQAIAESLASSTLYVSDTDNLNINVNALVTELDGSGLYVNGTTLAVNVNAIVADLDGAGLYVDGVTLAVNTNVIATKAYVDSVAQGLDVKASVAYASTANLDNAFVSPGASSADMTAAGLADVSDGNRVLLKNQTSAAENGIYIATYQAGLERYTFARAADATFDTTNGEGTLTNGAFTFVENGANAGKGFVVSELSVLAGVWYNNWSQFSEAGSLTAGTNIYLQSGQINVNVNSLVGDIAGSGLYVSGNDLAVNVNALVGDLDGTGLYVDGTTLAVNVNALAGTGLTVNGNQLEAAPAFITTVDESFAVTDGELSLSNTITIASVELTDSVNNVTAASDVFGNGSTSAYDMGSNETIGTLPAAYEVADVFVTLESSTGASRTSKFTHVNTGGDAPTWTEYGIIVSGSFPATTISFDASGNVIANVTGSATYSAKGVATILK
jgi:hypothetical protein